MKRTLADVLVESKDASAIVGERGDVRRLSSRSRAHVQDQITWSVVAHSVKNSNQFAALHDIPANLSSDPVRNVHTWLRVEEVADDYGGDVLQEEEVVHHPVERWSLVDLLHLQR